MKKTTCRNLRGACDAEIQGKTPEEMGENSKQHVMEMMKSGDEDHKAAIASMQQLSKEEQMKWYEDFKKGFDSSMAFSEIATASTSSDFTSALGKPKFRS